MFEPRSDAQSSTRRNLLTTSGVLAAVAVAGCGGESSPLPGNGGNGGGSGSGSGDGSQTGTFQLLISDQPTAIEEFDSLEVTFEEGRLFRAEDDETDTEEDSTATMTTNTTTMDTATGTETTTMDTTSEMGTMTTTVAMTDTESEETDSDNDAIITIDIGGETADLTELVGEKALEVFDGEVPAGRYSKIELEVREVNGVVDGEEVDVKVPSGKLMITKPFEVEADGDPLEFVFDITVVKKGKSGGYNLIPVIAKSGVAGKDVKVDRVGSNSSQNRGGQGANNSGRGNRGNNSGY